jgi:hypothetical protein
MKRSSSKTALHRPLVLQRETIALLAPARLTEVAGGAAADGLADDSRTDTSLTTRSPDDTGG